MGVGVRGRSMGGVGRGQGVRGGWARGEVGVTYSSSSSPSSQVSMRLPSGSLLQGQYSLPFDLLICHHYIPPSGGFWACLWGVWVCTSWAYLSGVFLWRASGVCLSGVCPIEVSLWLTSRALWRASGCASLGGWARGLSLGSLSGVALGGVESYLLGVVAPTSGVVALRGGLVWAWLSGAPRVLGWWVWGVGVGLVTP